MSQTEPSVLTQPPLPSKDVVREQAASFGDDNNSTATSRKTPMEIITMLCGLIIFNKSLFNEKLQRDGKMLRGSGKNELDIMIYLSTR